MIKYVATLFFEVAFLYNKYGCDIMKLIVDKITKCFDDKIVLDKLSYEFSSGKIYSVVGRNGVGKTTLFNIIDNCITKDSGDIVLDINGNKIKSLDDRISYVKQEDNLPLFLTPMELMKFYCNINKIDKDINYYFDILDVDKRDRNKIIKDLSVGNRAKINMIIGIINSCDVLLLDDPLISLDILSQEKVKKLIKEVSKKSIVIITTHILDIAIELSDEILLLDNKKLVKINKTDKDYKKIIIKSLEKTYD